MHLLTASIALQATLFAGTTLGLGINCRGSDKCHGEKGRIEPIRNNIYNLSNIYNVNDDFPISNGEHIACSDSYCAFLQGVTSPDGRPGTKTIGQIKTYIDAIWDHGCRGCGSDPTEPGNDVSKGQLTVNFVTDVGSSWVDFGEVKNWNSTTPPTAISRRHARSFDKSVFGQKLSH